MVAVVPDLGHGTTIAFDTGFLARLLTVRWTGIERDAIEAATMDDTGGMVFLPADQYNPGELECEFQLKTDDAPPITAAAETLTLTFPDAETWAASGFLRSVEFDLGDRTVNTMRAVVKFSGDITF